MAREFWQSMFLALMDKRQPTSFWVVVLLFLRNAWVPVVGDHEQVFKIARASPLQGFEHPDRETGLYTLYGTDAGSKWCVNGSVLPRREAGTS